MLFANSGYPLKTNKNETNCNYIISLFPVKRFQCTYGN